MKIEVFFAIGDVGGRARSWCRPRPCEFVGWVLVDAALSSDISLLHLLVVGVVNTFFLLYNCGAILQHFTCTNAAWQHALVLAAMTNLPIVLLESRHEPLGEYSLKRNANGGNCGQPAFGMLLQGSTHRLHLELTYVFGTWRISCSRCSIWCAIRQQRI